MGSVRTRPGRQSDREPATACDLLGQWMDGVAVGAGSRPLLANQTADLVPPSRLFWWEQEARGLAFSVLMSVLSCCPVVWFVCKSFVLLSFLHVEYSSHGKLAQRALFQAAHRKRTDYYWSKSGQGT
jgi:hypothetical protein